MVIALAVIFFSISMPSFAEFEGTTYVQDNYTMALNVLSKDGEIAELEFWFNPFGDILQEAEAFKVGFTVYEKTGRESVVRMPGEYLVGENFGFFPDPHNGNSSVWCILGKESKIGWTIKSNYDSDNPKPSVIRVEVNNIQAKKDRNWLTLYSGIEMYFSFTTVKPDDLNFNGVPFELEDVYILYTMFFDIRTDNIHYSQEDLNFLCDIDGNKIFETADLDWAVKVFLAASLKFAGKAVPVSWEEQLLSKYPGEVESIKAFVGMLKEKMRVQTAVEETAPRQFYLGQNYPNPFNPSTTIPFSLSESGNATVEVYTLSGQKISTLADDWMSAGLHSVVWKPLSAVASGVYFVRLQAGQRSLTKRILFMK